MSAISDSEMLLNKYYNVEMYKPEREVALY